MRFDPGRLAGVGEPAPLHEEVLLRSRGAADFALAQDGTLVHVPPDFAAERRLVWVDRTGARRVVTDEPRGYRWPALSPDGSRVAVSIGTGQTDQNIWIYDLDRDTLTRVLSAEGGSTPLWTPDGTTLLFSRAEVMYSTPADGSGNAEVLLTGRFPSGPASWSSDGRSLVFVESNPITSPDIWTWPLDGDPVPLLNSEFAEHHPAVAPSGGWLAYASNETGRDEIYMQAYPGLGGKLQISTDGGTQPVWSPDGRELLFRAGDRMMIVDVETEPTLRTGTSRALFEGNFYAGRDQRVWVSSEGESLLMLEPAETSGLTLTVVLNWHRELERLVPVE